MHKLDSRSRNAQYEEEFNIKIEFSVESEPLGTAGPLKLAEKILGKDNSPFFVLNSDIICDYPFKALAAFHAQHGQEGTIVVTKVEEPSKYGVVVHSADHPSRIERFVEKPVEFVGNRINAGIYLLNPSVLKRIELRPTSIEQETFPAICNDGELHSFDLEGYWMDVGQPKDFLSGTCLYLSSLTQKNSPKLAPKGTPYVYGGNVLVDPSAKVGKNCRIGPNVTIGPNVVIGDGVRIQRSVLLKGTKVKDHAWVKSTIVGWNSTVGRWARLENVSVLGDDVSIGDEVYVNGGSILPHKSIKANVDGTCCFLFPLPFIVRSWIGVLVKECSLTVSPSSCHNNVKNGKRTRAPYENQKDPAILARGKGKHQKVMNRPRQRGGLESAISSRLVPSRPIKHARSPRQPSFLDIQVPRPRTGVLGLFPFIIGANPSIAMRLPCFSLFSLDTGTARKTGNANGENTANALF